MARIDHVNDGYELWRHLANRKGRTYSSGGNDQIPPRFMVRDFNRHIPSRHDEVFPYYLTFYKMQYRFHWKKKKRRKWNLMIMIGSYNVHMERIYGPHNT